MLKTYQIQKINFDVNISNKNFNFKIINFDVKNLSISKNKF